MSVLTSLHEVTTGLGIRLPWLPVGQRVLLTHQSSLRRSLTRSDSYDIWCAYKPITEDGELGYTAGAWAPFEQLSLLQPGAIFDDQMLVGRLDALATRRATRFQPHSMCQLSESSLGEIGAKRLRAIGTPPDRAVSLSPWSCIGDDGSNRFYIPSTEILRFYFGAVSGVAAQFMSPAYGGAPGDGLVDLENTRFIEPGVFQIAPAPGLADRGSALHLAMLLNSPDLMALWRSTVDQFVASGARNAPDFYPAIELSEQRHSFGFLGQSSRISEFVIKRWSERAFIVWSIQSDFRPAPFKRLVIKLPYGMGEADLARLEDEQLEPSSRYQNIVAPGMALGSYRRPGVQAAVLSPFHASVQRTFPGLARVQVDYDIKRGTLRSSPPSGRQPQERRLEALSALAPGRDGRVGRVLLRPGRTNSFEPLETTAPTEELFNSVEFELGTFEPLGTSEPSFPLPTFMRAFGMLLQHQTGGLVGQAPFEGLRVMRPPSSWGPAARGRSIAIGCIEANGRAIFAFEMSRRHRAERISLGLVARLDGAAMSLADLSAVGRYAIQQLSMRGTDSKRRARGVWPSPSTFVDLRGRIVTHTARRRLAGVLAEDLDALAHSLFEFPTRMTQAA